MGFGRNPSKVFVYVPWYSDVSSDMLHDKRVVKYMVYCIFIYGGHVGNHQKYILL
jgi:hypothetical protein